MNKNVVKSLWMLVTALLITLFANIGVFAASDFKIEEVDDGKTIALLEYTGDSSKVIVPNGVEVISTRAFENNKKIKELVLPNSVTEIGEYAFKGCTNLKTIKFSKSLNRIWTGAFMNCKKLESLKINKNLKYIDEYALWGCEGLKKVKVEKGNKHFKVYKGALYSKNMKKLYIYPSSNKSRKKYTIPKKVKLIEDGVFYKNKYLTEVVFKGATSGGDDCFIQCKSLKKVVFKKAYKQWVGFENCKKLEEVILAEGTIRIGPMQFEGCKNLTKLNFPSSLKYIDEYAFSGCTNLDIPTLPKSVKVNEKAFN